MLITTHGMATRLGGSDTAATAASGLLPVETGRYVPGSRQVAVDGWASTVVTHRDRLGVAARE